LNTNRLNRWLTLLANLGVLAGIILLLVELNQNQEIARAQIRNEVYQGLTDSLAILDRDTAEVIGKANAGVELDPVEVILVGRWSETILRYWENADYQYEMGMYDDTEYSAQKNIIRTGMLEIFPGAVLPHYCRFRNGYSDHFRAMIDAFVTPEMCAGYIQ